MARTYSVFADNIAAAYSATVPIAAINGAATIRTRIFDLMLGSPAVADNAASWQIKRTSSAAAAGTAVTPSPLDVGDPASLAGAAYVAPSVTAVTLGVAVLSWAQNQRATFRWVAAPGKELVSAASATTNGGWALMKTVETAAFNVSFTIQYEE